MTAPARSVENLRKNLRALIQNLVVETRKASFNPNDPATQNLLKRFASQAHTYQVAAKNAGKKLNKAAAMENIRGNAKKAVENAAAAAAAATVENMAGSAAEAAKANVTPSALRASLVAMKNKAAMVLRNLRAPKPAAPPVFGPAPRPFANKIIASYNSKAVNNTNRFNAASRMAGEYRNAPKFKKNFTKAALKLTAFSRGGAAGQYESRQKFLNEMAAFYKKQVNNQAANASARAAELRGQANAPLHELANAYVKSLYSKTGRFPWGPATSKNIVEKNPINTLIAQRKNITNAALQRFLTGPTKPTQRNANKRINHLKEIITTAHQFGAARDALLNIAAKKGPLDEIVKTNTLATLNSNQLKKRSENINSRFAEYKNAVQRASSLLNANEIREVDKVSTQLERSVQTAKAAAAAAALAKKIITNLNGKTGANLTASIAKAKNDIKNIPNGTKNRTRAQAAINAANAKAAPPPPPAAPRRGASVAAIADPMSRPIPSKWMLNANYKAYSKNLVSNIYAKKNTNTTYRKVSNVNGNFANQTNYTWDAVNGNFKP